ncbi:class I SAM-dependent methyltransferase [Caldalkalibacillus mannanilyticus]|uniref:class I SAM-dependent methyltransferase n=1 Tax=Caldalkalibacillus mannanilyticus TaxID=1418 RepID=UPI00055867DE|nr:methyltransferase domain-containing protein [Caldalkalibacillus mannanilyticus]
MNKMEFLQGFLRSPLEVGSVIPSSKFMVNKVINCISQEKPQTIVELGAGTGVLTRELVKHCKDKDTLIVFEKDEQMRRNLTREFSGISLYADALDLDNVLEQLGTNQVDCIISGLPFTLFPNAKKEELFEKIYSRLKNNGCFVMYQYTTQLKHRLREMFDDVKIHLVWLNLPPTFVYVCKKK